MLGALTSTLRAAVLLCLLGTGAMALEAKVQAYALPAGAGPMRLAPGDREGAIWFSSRNLGALGRLMPQTGEVEMTSLGQGARPTGLARAGNGHLLAVDNAADIVHDLDPATGELTRHSVQSPGGLLELNSAVMDRDGRLWFTGYSGFYGFLDPASGQSSVWPAAGGRGPVAMTHGADDSLWYASYAGAYIARIDPRTGKCEQHALPAGQEGPKSLAIDRSGKVWVAAYRSGSLLQFDPRIKGWSSWRLPGRDPKPYGVMVDAAAQVWMTDTGDASLVRFDPRTKAFATVAPTSPRGMARDLIDVDGTVWTAESAGDRILRVQPSLERLARQ